MPEEEKLLAVFWIIVTGTLLNIQVEVSGRE